MNIYNPLLLAKKITRQQYRSAIKTESDKRRVDTKNKIIETNSSNKQLFHKLVKKQRQKGNSLISDLNVGNEQFEGDTMIEGWFSHFKNLATPTDCSDFNEHFLNLCKDDYSFIKQYTSTCERKKVSVSLVKRALKHIHKENSEDCF